jgi:predicted nucleotidyltransferase
MSTTLRPADALFGKVRQQVLGLLFANPDRDYYQQEIARFAGAHLSAVQRELQRLEAAGLITTHRRGRQVYYQANRRAPLFPELRGLALKTTGLADVLRAALAPLADQIQVAFLFGSVASGEERPDSDVDLMVIGQTGLYDLTPTVKETENQLSREINPVTMPPEEWAERLADGDHFLTSVEENPKVFLIGDENELVRIREGRALAVA